MNTKVAPPPPPPPPTGEGLFMLLSLVRLEAFFSQASVSGGSVRSEQMARWSAD